MENSEITVHTFELFKSEPHMAHGVFTRQGGTSAPPFDSLNIGMNSGDQTDHVAENRKRMIKKMGMNPFIFLNQVHGSRITVLKKEGNNLSEIFEPGKETYRADGIVTDIKDVFLVIQVADCQAIVLYDPQKKVIANVHSGWRGSIENIIGKCLDKMVSEFGCRPETILAGISPSLGPCCSEFINYKDEIPRHLWKYKIGETDYFDFWALSADQLTEKGVKKEHIENMNICTKCNTDQFYSFRGEKPTGRFAAVIAMV